MESDDEGAALLPSPPALPEPLRDVVDEELSAELKRALVAFAFAPELQDRIVAENLTTKAVLAVLFEQHAEFAQCPRALVKEALISTLQDDDPLLADFNARVLVKKKALAACEGIIDQRRVGMLTLDAVQRGELLLALMMKLSRQTPTDVGEQRLARVAFEFNKLLPLDVQPDRSNVDDFPAIMFVLRGVIAIFLGKPLAWSAAPLKRLRQVEEREVFAALAVSSDNDIAHSGRVEFIARVDRAEDALRYAPFSKLQARMGWMGMSAPKLFAALQLGIIAGEPITLHGKASRAALDGEFLCLVKVAVEGEHCTLVTFDGVVDTPTVDGTPLLPPSSILTCREEAAAVLRYIVQKH